ncbi:MAG: RNA methyltransferase [Candidatus Cybelea sp.]
MATQLGRHAQRLTGVRALRTGKGRSERQRFAFEGSTLLAEAVAAGFPIEEVYATQAAYDSTVLLHELESQETPVFIVDEAALAGISDLETPSGIVTVAPIRLHRPDELFRRGSPLLVLADVNDPANAGTLLRSADAFGCPGVLFGRLGVDPYHPKVVRGSMGAAFRIALSVADPPAAAIAAADAGVRLLGLAAGGTPICPESWQAPLAIIVGHERRGLGRWESLCEQVLAIPMSGAAESLSAAVAGSIALFEASREAHSQPCQESGLGQKSQDYR